MQYVGARICKKGKTEKIKQYIKRKLNELLILSLKNMKGKIKNNRSVKNENIACISRYEPESETKFD